MSTHRNYSDLVVFRRLLRESRPYLPHAVLLFLISVLAAPVALLLPLPLKIAVDNVIGDEPLPGWLAAILPAGVENSTTALLVAVAVMLVLITLLGELRSLTESVFGAYTGERLLLAFRTKLFRQGQRLSLAYHDSVGTADSAYRIEYDSWAIRTILLSGVTPLVTAVVTLVSMLFIVSRLDAQLALIALTVAPFMFGLTWISRTRSRKGWREAKTVESSSLSVIQEALTRLRVVKAFGREDHEEAGVTGAGKSTLVSLLCRFYDPRAGQILLDGVDIADFKVADLRDQYGIVLQEPALFSTTVAENIAYSRPDATFDEIALYNLTGKRIRTLPIRSQRKA